MLFRSNDPSMPTWCASKYGGVFGPSSGLGTLATLTNATGTMAPTVSPSPLLYNSRLYTSNGGTGVASENVIFEMSIFWHANSGYYVGMLPMFVPLDTTTVASYIGR